MSPEVPSSARFTNSFAGTARLNICLNFIARTDSGDQMFAAANALRKVQGEVCADGLVSNEIFEAHCSVRRRVIVKFDSFEYAFLDYLMHGGVEMGLRQTLTQFEIALIKKVVSGSRHPVDVPEPAVHADTCTV